MSDSTEANKVAPQPAAERIRDDEKAYLAALGARVRQLREKAGHTRKRLAIDAGVSERYLAQLELGNGNASMLLLRKLALALHSPLNAMVEPAGHQREADSPALKTLMASLRQLDEDQLAEFTDTLRQRYGSAWLTRRSRVALIGLRGAGKSTIGNQLASRLGIRFIELDHEIERELGSDLAGIFSVYGQDAYRDGETRVLDRLLQSTEPFVLATGGSIVKAPSAYSTVRASCFTVWLQAAPADHMSRVMEQGDMRPMRGREHAMAELEHILNSRRELYQLADQTINTSTHSLSACVDEIAVCLDS